MDIRNIPTTKATNATASQRVSSDICPLVIIETFLAQEKIILAQTLEYAACYYQKTYRTWDPSNFFLKVQYDINNPNKIQGRY